VASNFPTSLDNFTNPSSGNTLDSPSHSLQHSDINDAVEALEAKLGIGASPAGSASAGQVLTISAAGTSTWSPVSALTTTQFLHIRDEKAATTQGGTFTNGAWRTRDLNTIKTNTITGASLASNQITLPAGTYFMQGYPVAFRVEGNIARIYNITDSSQVSLGQNSYTATSPGSQSPTNVSCIVTITGTKVFELQHYAQTTAATIGFGIRNETGVGEVYSEILIWKIG